MFGLNIYRIYLSITLFSLIVFSANLWAQQQRIPVQLAEVYQAQNVQNYLISEKYDGIRAVWKNQQLRTRKGKLIHAPKWFTQKLPNVWLDGELWFARQQFEYVASTVSKKKPIDAEWHKIKYMVFDAPNLYSNFATRAAMYKTLIQDLKLPHIQAVEQFTLNDNTELMHLLEAHTKAGAEGLMLQLAKAKYKDGRSSNLLKLKAYMDAEATVIAYKPGKGKYQDRLGALLVEYRAQNGKQIQFKIGTGFSDNERLNPPSIGSVITFKHHGFTRKGVPRFASYLRVRKD